MGRNINFRLIIGLALVVLGGLFLLDNFHVIYFDVPYWIFKWQSILIIIGLILLANSDNKSAGFILIAIGLFGWFPHLWPLLLIGIGVYILYKRKDSTIKTGDETSMGGEPGNSNDYFDDTSIFGGGKKRINSNNFKGGRITAIFGGSEIDLYDCNLALGTNIIDVFTMFGGVELIVPADWNVKIETLSIFGAFTDKRRQDSNQIPDPERKLVLKGLVLFGGGNIKS